MQLSRTEGTVTVTNSGGKAMNRPGVRQVIVSPGTEYTYTVNVLTITGPTPVAIAMKAPETSALP